MSFKVLVLLSLPLVALTACPSGSVYDGQFNKCYKYQTDTIPFFMAEQTCFGLGGHLASIQNGFENAMVTENAKNYFGGKPDFWIGANLLMSSNWSWTDGTKFSYNNWNGGIPTNSTNQCGAITIVSSYWNAAACGIAKPYVCVIPQITSTPAPCPTPTMYASCESGWTFSDKTNFCYKVLLNEKFDDASNLCQDLKGNLASVHNQVENDFVAGMAATGLTLDYSQMAWIGIHKNQTGAWVNMDGTPVNYFNWAPSQPDNSGGIENCIQILPDELSGKHEEGHRLKWNDIRCDESLRAFVCKKYPTYI